MIAVKMENTLCFLYMNVIAVTCRFNCVLFQNKTNDSSQMCVVEETFIFFWRENIVAQTL